jgi:hypothetical protein
VAVVTPDPIRHGRPLRATAVRVDIQDMARSQASHRDQPDEHGLRLPAPLHRLINTDGTRHPKENALAFLTLGLGVLSLIAATNEDWHIPGSWVGLVGAVIGGIDQFISKTRGERWIIVIGLIASALGFALNLANGGLA